MIENDPIPKQTLTKFLNELNINSIGPVIKINAAIDITVPGRRKFCHCQIELRFHEKFVILKLLNQSLYPAFPIKFDSRVDVFSQSSHTCFCLEGYSYGGKHRLIIFPQPNIFEDCIFITE